MNRLHIYAQEWEHQKAYIVGSEDALNSLRDAIHTALREHTSESRVIFAADGEGYRVHFIALEDGQKIRRALAMVPSIEFYRYEVSFKLKKA